MQASTVPRVLVVEDDAAVSLLEKRRLEKAGYQVEVAIDADEALRALRRDNIDLILLDYRLPGEMDGLEFYERVRQLNFDVPVILVTGFSNEATVIRALRAGVRDFVTKSLEYLDYLPEAVEHVLKQVRIEQQLADSEARLATIVNSAKDAIIIVEESGKIILFNHAAEQMFLCSCDQALQQSADQLIPDWQKETRRLESSEVVGAEDIVGQSTESQANRPQGGRLVPRHLCLFGKRTTGETFPLEASISKVAFRGRTNYAIVVRDITERFRAEEALRQSEDRYRGMFEDDLTADFLATSTGEITLCNEAFVQLVGMESMDQVKLRNIEDFLPAKGELEKLLERLRRREKLKLEERLVRRHDGNTAKVLANMMGLFSADGEMIGFKGYLMDVTELRHAEQAVRRSESQFQQIWDRSLDGICLIDTEGVIRMVNPAYCELIGKPREALVGHSFRVTMSYEYGEYFMGEFQQSMRNRSFEPRATITFTRWDGQTIMLETANSILLLPDQPPMFMTLIRDVTEQKNLELAFRQSQKMEAIGQLAGGVAHDFNNLLTIINGYSDVLISGNLGAEKATEFQHEIRRAGERAASLTRQLLAFSRRQILKPEVIDLNGMIEELEKMLGRLIGEDVLLATALDPTLGAIHADRGQIEQVIMNLVVNARDSMPTGGRLTIETHNVEISPEYCATRPGLQPGWFAQMAVSDTGCGMTEAVKSQIFEPFFTTKDVGKGTGLGLAAVFGIVKQSAGTIEVYSEPGRGSTFKVYLPLAAAPAASSPSAESSTSLLDGNETILLAEDEAAVRHLIGLALRSHGYNVLEACDGSEALNIATEYTGQIHLLMTDVVMPHMSGRQLADDLLSKLPEIRILYLSGYTDDAVVRHGLIEDHVAFLQKPFTPNALVRKVREVLDAPAQR